MNNSRSKNSRNLLLISHNLEPEGATWSLYFIAVGLKKLGFKVNVISPKSGPLKEKYKDFGINVEIVNYYSEKYLFELNNYDVIYVNTILGYKFIGDNISSRHKIIWCIRESEREVYFKNYVDLKIDFFKNVNKVVFVANSTRKIYEDLNVGNFETINNGIDYKKIDDFINNSQRNLLRSNNNISDETIVISIIGTVCLRKGQLEFVQAAVRVLESNENKKLLFIIVGGRGDNYEKIIRELIEKSNLKNKFKIISEVPGAYDYYLMSDIFVCNSYIESFPRVVLEAMAFKLPIIATKVYGIPEQINDGREGLLVTAGDVNELKDKMLYLINNKEIAEDLGNNARQRVIKEFSCDVMLDKYCDLIEKVCVE